MTLSNAAGVVSTTPTPLKVTHAVNCAAEQPTLTLQLPTVVTGSLTTTGDLAVGGALTGFPVQPSGSQVCSPACFTGSNLVSHPATFGGARDSVALGWADWITQPLVLTKTSLVLLSYQVSTETNPVHFCLCRLFQNADALIGTRAITGGDSKMYGTISGQWVGTMPAGTHSIKLNCRNSEPVRIDGYFETQDLSVTVLGWPSLVNCFFDFVGWHEAQAALPHVMVPSQHTRTHTHTRVIQSKALHQGLGRGYVKQWNFWNFFRLFCHYGN